MIYYNDVVIDIFYPFHKINLKVDSYFLQSNKKSSYTKSQFHVKDKLFTFPLNDKIQIIQANMNMGFSTYTVFDRKNQSRSNSRCDHPEVFCEINVLNTFTKFIRKHLLQSLSI